MHGASNRQQKSSMQQEGIDFAGIKTIFEEDFVAGLLLILLLFMIPLRSQYITLQPSELFLSRCQDTGQRPDPEKAKMFRQGFSKINLKRKQQKHLVNLYSMRLGVNTIMKLIAIMESHKEIRSLNMSDNAISQYGMHAIKNLLSSTHIEQLIVASNMISEVGLALVLNQLMQSLSLKLLDIGIHEGSIRKNSIGVDGSRCLAAVLLQNKVLEVLRLQDNDIGISGAEVIAIALRKNKTLKELKIAENNLKTQGAEFVLNNAMHLKALHLGRNFIKSSIGPVLKKYFETNKNLRRLNVQFNELLAEGCQICFEGVVGSQLEELSLRGNGLQDQGVSMIKDVVDKYTGTAMQLKMLDLGSNNISRVGILALLGMLKRMSLNTLILNKNPLANEGLKLLAEGIPSTATGDSLTKIDISTCKICDEGFLCFMEALPKLTELSTIKCCDNFVSEKYEKLFIEHAALNHQVTCLNLIGNRLSLSGMKKLKTAVDHNVELAARAEPDRLKSEIEMIKDRQRRLKEAGDKIDQQRKSINGMEEQRHRLNEHLAHLNRQHASKMELLEEEITKKHIELEGMEVMLKKEIANQQKEHQLLRAKVEVATKQLDGLRAQKRQLQNQYEATLQEGKLLKDQFLRKSQEISKKK